MQQLTAIHDLMQAWRRDLHAHPELGFEEHRTAEFVAAKLTEFGFQVTKGVGLTGVVGTLQRGGSQRSIGLRADLDALPITEENTFKHCSVYAGKMHACGHDGHTTMLLGAAKYLAATQQFNGIVHLIFQPAEEGIGGAKKMIADGLFSRFPCDAIFAMHNKPGLDVGKFAVHPGPTMAGGAFFDIEIYGCGAHAAKPEASVDPIILMSQIIMSLQTVISRTVSPKDIAVLSITKVSSGNAYNVIPNTAHISGTVRAFDAYVMDQIEVRMKQLVTSICAGFQADCKISFKTTFAPLVNDIQETKFAYDICKDLVGEKNVHSDIISMASEDFSFMLQKVPGCYIHIGNGLGEGACEVHNPNYDFNDDILVLGASFFAKVVEQKLSIRG